MLFSFRKASSVLSCWLLYYSFICKLLILVKFSIITIILFLLFRPPLEFSICFFTIYVSSCKCVTIWLLFTLTFKCIWFKFALVLQVFAVILSLLALSYILMQFALEVGSIFENKYSISFGFSILKVAYKQRPIWFKHPA